MMMTGGQLIAHQAMMNSCPAYNINHQDPLDIRPSRFDFPPSKPFFAPVDTTPYPNLVVDPVSKLADAEWDYHRSKLSHGLELAERVGGIDSAHDLDCLNLARDTYGVIKRHEEDSCDLGYRSATEAIAKTNALLDCTSPALDCSPSIPLVCLRRTDFEEERVKQEKAYQIAKEARQKEIEKAFSLLREESNRRASEINDAIRLARITPIDRDVPTIDPDLYGVPSSGSRWAKTKSHGDLFEKHRSEDPDDFIIGSKDYRTHTHIGYDSTGRIFASIKDETTDTHPFRFDPIGSQLDDARFATQLRGAPEPEPYYDNEPEPHHYEPPKSVLPVWEPPRYNSLVKQNRYDEDEYEPDPRIREKIMSDLVRRPRIPEPEPYYEEPSEPVLPSWQQRALDSLPSRHSVFSEPYPHYDDESPLVGRQEALDSLRKFLDSSHSRSRKFDEDDRY